MGLLSFLKYFWADFRKQKKRATLTMAAIVWGTMSILLLLAFGQGLKEQLLRNQAGLGENIMIVWGGQTSMPYEGLPRGRRIRFLPEDVEVIKRASPRSNASAPSTRAGASISSVARPCSRSMLPGSTRPTGKCAPIIR